MIAKRFAASITALCTLMSTASVVFADGNDTQSENEKIITLSNADTAFNHIVVKNPDLMPEDLAFEYSDDDGATWTEFEYNVDNNGVMGYIYGGSGDGLIKGSESGNYCTYREYAADKIKISSKAADVEQLVVGVYNAKDIAPTAQQIKANNSLITAVGDNGERLFMEETYNGNRLNNTSNTNPAYLYNADTNGNILYGTGGTDNKTGSVIINLGDEKSISKIGFGEMIGSNYSAKNRHIGDKFAAYYNKDGVWQLIEEVDNNTENTKFNHATINSEKVKTDKVKLTFTFNGNVNGAALPNLEQGAAKPTVKAIWLSYIGVYDFGENLVYQDYKYESESISLGDDSVTFNTIDAEDTPMSEYYKWQYSEDGSDWTDYSEGTEVNAKYIRIISSMSDVDVPEFELKWKGNLVKYAASGINGAAAEGDLRGNAENLWLNLTDDDKATNVGLLAADKTGDITFDLKAPAKFYSIHGYYGSGCWYPQEYTVEMSNQGTEWVKDASEKFELRKNAAGVHADDASHNDAFDYETDLGSVTAAMMRIQYRKSMRAACTRDENYSGNDIRITELNISGAVTILRYDGENASLAVPDDDPPAFENYSNYSEPIDLGRIVTFNKLNCELSPEEETLKWQYSEDGLAWNGFVINTQISTRYIRVAAASQDITPVVPEFRLSWEGNLIEYASEGYNGAEKTGTLNNNDAWKYLYDGDTTGTSGTAVLAANDQRGDLTFDLKSPATINSLHGYYGTGCWYPSSYTVEMSNKGNIWVQAASEKFQLRLNSSGEHPTSEAIHYSQFDYETSFRDAEAAMIKIQYRGSMRAICDNNDTISDTRISELVLDGSVKIADYDGLDLSFSSPDSDPPAIRRESSKIFVDGAEQDVLAGTAHINEGTHEISGEIISEKGNGAAYLAVYENDILKSVAADSEPVSDGYSNEYKATLTCTVPLSHPTLEIKLFFWDKNTMEPLRDPVVIKESMFTIPKSENNSMFKKGDVVGFIGDSITHADNMNTPNYMSFIYDYYITRMPNEPIKLVNVGIASYTAGDVLKTFDENVAVGGIRRKDGSAWANINRATLMIGMNDINRGLYYQNSMANNAAQRQAKIDESCANTETILTKLNGIGVENNDITLITPSIFDNTKVSNATSSNPCLANDGLVILAENDKKLAAEKGTNLVEFNAPMLEINKAYQARNYDGTIIRDDLVHPRGMGHTMMGYLFLRQQGAGGEVAVADLANGEYTNCDVDVKSKYANYIEYTYTPKSIPLAASSDYQAANEYVDITNDLNREIIKADLHEGKYKLSIDGAELGTYTDKDFQTGVNIATLSKNPNQIISQEIEKLNIERRNNEIRIRNTWFQEFNKDTVAYFNWVNIVSSYDETKGRFVADPNYKEKDEYKNASQADKNSMDTYAEVKLNPDKFTDEIDNCIAEMYSKAQQAVTTSHTVKIERVGTSSEGIQLPNFFTANMVLQRGKAHTIWGKGREGAEYTVTLSNGESTSLGKALTDENGDWSVDLKALPVSDKTYTLTVEGDGEFTTVEGIKIGDVYFIAGQSNVEQAVKHLPSEIEREGGYTIDDAPTPITNENISFINLATVGSQTRTFDVKYADGMSGWAPLNDSNKNTLSLIGMFFADKMQKKENVPIGLISTAWGGTRIDRWSSSGYQDSNNIYNNHAYPFINYKINGILWYQGCSDADNDNWLAGYQNSFPQLIDDWREDWGDEELPFIYAQLARYDKSNFMRIREAQRNASDKVSNPKNLAMIVTVDTDKGTSCNIHPLGKEIIAERFYNAARNIIFNDTDAEYQGPMFESAVPAGNKIVVSFKEGTAEGLKIKNPDYSIAQDGSGCSSSASLNEFEIAGEDMNFVPAVAVISGKTVEVSAASVAEPKYVRYAYSRSPENPNLYNGSDLPCSPFTSVKEINMVCMGDSITYGFGIAKNEDKYTERLKAMLNEETNTAYEYNVLNMGVSGRCITSKSNSPYTQTSEYRQGYFASADIYTIALGTNDSKNYITDTENAMNFSHIDELEDDYSAIIEKIKARNPKAKIYVCLPIPVLNDGEGAKGNGVGINEENETQIREHIRNVADKYGLDIIDLNQAFLDAFDNGVEGMDTAKYVDMKDNNTGYTYTGVQRYLYDKNVGSGNDSINIDDVHPGPNGAKLIADTIFAEIKADGLIK